MNKYDDWQRYVKEQMEKADQKKRETVSTQPKRPVPSIDRERFSIKRQTIETPMSGPAAAPGASKPAAVRPSSQPARAPAAQESEDVGAHSSTITSPFVSVHDVWEAAERSSKSRKISKDEATTLVQQKRLPGIERVSRVETPAPPDPPRSRVLQAKSREEILERLVNPTLTLEEAAKVMGVCKATVRRYTAKGILPHYRTPGNQRRFKLNDIISFLENQRK